MSRLDLPTFERPVMAISGRSPGGAAPSLSALRSNVADVTRQPPVLLFSGLDGWVMGADYTKRAAP
ncbi:hypothetical protein OV079_10755 [Nannocystis pusilla]|uniref:Uncharacterized protein n=1 Tax=Nannocystis pusilla TaxID=889268 RepID=A0A9X3EL21_9BACT|nr:hypothetical protein [Nannocystis pusilla]MCY1006034.1 hypothetical protein [Nannocystis pusilla]